MFEEIELIGIARRFWPKVRKGGQFECWEWLATRNKAGYGVFMLRAGNNCLAHRVSYALTVGPDSLRDGLHIAHLCHNRACVNPHHLMQATPGANIQQSKIAGRISRGARYKNSKLTDDAVREIRKVAKDLDGECAMMLKYRVSQMTVKWVYERRQWKHVVD